GGEAAPTDAGDGVPAVDALAAPDERFLEVAVERPGGRAVGQDDDRAEPAPARFRVARDGPHETDDSGGRRDDAAAHGRCERQAGKELLSVGEGRLVRSEELDRHGRRRLEGRTRRDLEGTGRRGTRQRRDAPPEELESPQTSAERSDRRLDIR